jgi:hypothetical protein
MRKGNPVPQYSEVEENNASETSLPEGENSIDSDGDIPEPQNDDHVLSQDEAAERTDLPLVRLSTLSTTF